MLQLEEIVMAMMTRKDFYRCSTRIDTTRIYPTSRMVSALTGLSVQLQQGDRWRKRVRARIGHPPGWNAEIPRDVRNHGSGFGGYSQVVVGPGQA